MPSPSNISLISEWQTKLDHSERSRELEKGRSEVLKMAASGCGLKETLHTLCIKANRYNSDMFCSILSLNELAGTLHPLAAHGLPDAYCNALDGKNWPRCWVMRYSCIS